MLTILIGVRVAWTVVMVPVMLYRTREDRFGDGPWGGLSTIVGMTAAIAPELLLLAGGLPSLISAIKMT